MQTVVYAKIEAENSGSYIVLRFGMSRAVLAFMTVWFFGVIVIGGTVFFTTVRALLSGNGPQETWVGIVAPVGMLVFGVCLTAFGRWLARNEALFLTQFIESVLIAEELPSASSL